MATKYEYYSTSPDNFGLAVEDNNWCATVFTASSRHRVTSVKLHMYRANSPGTVTVGLRAVASSQPTGSDLVSGTTDGDTLGTGSAGAWREITFSSSYELVDSTDYAYVIKTAGVSPNALYVKGKYLTSNGAGNARRSTDSGSSWSYYYAAPGKVTNFWFENWGSTALDSQSGTIIYSGSTPGLIRLAGPVTKGDPIGYSSGWKRALATAGSVVQFRCVAAEDGVEDQEITAYFGTVLLTGRLSGGAAGNPIYIADGSTAGLYTQTQPATSTAANTVVGYMLTGSLAMVRGSINDDSTV